MRSTARLIRFAALAIVLVTSSFGWAQRIGPALKIISPADGTRVSPGEIVSVSVSSPDASIVAGILILGEDPLEMSDVAKTVPAHFSITIPAEIPNCRRYSIRAMGITAARESVESEMIYLDVERPDTPVSLSSQFKSITLEVSSEPLRIMPSATFSDGKIFDVTESTNVTYQSSNTAVATVDEFGATKAVAPGTASIRIEYKNPNGGAVQLSVPVTVTAPSKTEAQDDVQ